MNLDLIGTGYLSQKGIVARDEDDQKHERSVAAPCWGAMFHPVLGQVWTHPDAESAPDLEQILLEESMHVQQTLNRPAHLFPLRRYLNCDPELPDAEVFRDIVECQYVALTPLLLRQPIASSFLPPAPDADREAAERILEMVEKLAVQDVTDLTTEQRRRYALSAITTVTGAVIPSEPGSLGEVLTCLASAVDRVEWTNRFELESLLVQSTELTVRTNHWLKRRLANHGFALDALVESPSEVLLANALQAAQPVLEDPHAVLPVLPSLNAVLSRRNDVPIVLARQIGTKAAFEILEHQEAIERQGQRVDEEMPGMETDEDLTPADSAWFRFDDHYLDYLEARAPELRVGDFAMAALYGLRAIVREGLVAASQEGDLAVFGDTSRMIQDAIERLGATTDAELETVDRSLRGYGDWLVGDGAALLKACT
jgi:hypothetical protein